MKYFFSYHPQTYKEKILYLTFDDGPEPNITEFIIDLLKKYDAKATFFCCGNNCLKYSSLVNLIRLNKHKIGNHTDNHLNGLKSPVKKYIEDVYKCNQICQTELFRPPWGVINLREYFYLRINYKIILWDVVSGDTNKKLANLSYYKQYWSKNISSNSIILFHFSTEHEKNTRILLPYFLEIYSKLGYKFESII